MGKIKGWKELKRLPKSVRKWVNKNESESVTVAQNFNYKIWWFRVDNLNNPKIYHIEAKYNTKKEAVARAMKYMRSHPNG